jgi:hypothetical protein
MDMRAEDTADARWLTHAELAAARGISTASAIKLALRHRWRKQRDNRGTVRCLVPIEFIGPQASIGADAGAVSRAEPRADLSAAIATLQAALTLLGDQLSHERTRADAAVAERDDLHAKLADGRAEIAALREQLEHAQGEAAAAQETVGELRRVEAAQRGRGLVARLRAAWRGE